MSQLILPDEFGYERKTFKKDSPFVFMGVTAYDGKIHTGLAQSLLTWMFKAVAQKTFRFTPVFISCHTPLCSARNTLVKKFLSEEFRECTHFCLIDDDISPFEDTLEDLLKRDVDIISPLIFSVKLDQEGFPVPCPLAFNRHEEGGLTVNCKLEGLVETQNICGGYFIAKRKVIEKIEKPAFKYTFNETGEKTRGTDEHFSDLILNAGYKMYVDADVIVEQTIKIGTMSFNMSMIRSMEKGQMREVSI